MADLKQKEAMVALYEAIFWESHEPQKATFVEIFLDMTELAEKKDLTLPEFIRQDFGDFIQAFLYNLRRESFSSMGQSFLVRDRSREIPFSDPGEICCWTLREFKPFMGIFRP